MGKIHYIMAILTVISCTTSVGRASNVALKRSGSISFVQFYLSDINDSKKEYPEYSQQFIDSFNACLLSTGLKIVDRLHVFSTLKDLGQNMPADQIDLANLNKITGDTKIDYAIIGSGRINQRQSRPFLQIASFRIIEIKSGAIVISGFFEGPSLGPSAVGNRLGCETAQYYSY